MKNKIILFFTLFVLVIFSLPGFTSPFSWMFSHPNPESPRSKAWVQKEVNIIKAHTDNIDEKVLRLSLIAYQNARKNYINKKELLTVIDYSKPSTEKRLWVFDLKKGKTLFNTWVTHGKNSGDLNTKSFSNVPGSLKSSFGVFITDSSPYMGNNGYSLRMRGLEKGFNDKAYARDIVFHGARYVNADTIKKFGKIGRSWGCPAVELKTAKPLINTIKENTVVFAYYPDSKWLSQSKFLTA